MATAERTRNPFVPAITRFSDYLREYMQQQGQLADKVYKLEKQKRTEQFVTKYSNDILKTGNLKDLTSNLSRLITLATSEGLEGAIPVITSIAQVHQQTIGYEQAEKQANEFAQVLSDSYGSDAKVLYKGRITPIKDAIEEVRKISSDPMSFRMNVETLSKNILQQERGIVPLKDGGYAYTEGYTDRTGQSYGATQYAILDKEGKVMVDRDKNAIISEKDTELDPRTAIQYGAYLKQDKQIEAARQRLRDDSYKVSAPQYVWTDASGEEHMAFWDPNIRKIRDVNTHQIVKNAVPYKQSKKYENLVQTNTAVVNSLFQTGNPEAVKFLSEQLMKQGILMGDADWWKGLPTDNFETMAIAIAGIIGDNWDSPSNPNLRKAKDIIQNNKRAEKGNVYLENLLKGILAPSKQDATKSSIDTSYINKRL